MEAVNCDLCGSNQTKVLFIEKDLLHGFDGTFTLRRCETCGLMYLNPRPTAVEIQRYYPETYAPYQSLVDDPAWWIRSDFLYGQWKNYQALKSYLLSKSGRLLDIGCAAGGFLAAMRRWGDWDLYGVEIDARAAVHARDELDLNVIEGTLHEAAFENDFFDIVTMWNVIEHLHHPQSTLEEIARIIRPGGVIAVSTPNPHSLERYIFGRYWAGWDAPRHLYIYSPEVLKRALERARFEVIHIRSYSGGYSVLALTLENLIRDKISDRRQKLREFLNRVINFPLLRAISVPYYYVAGRLNLGSVMTIFARRSVEDR